MSFEDRKSALALKEQGNDAFKKKLYCSAIEKYSKSLEAYTDPIVLSNRAQAELNSDLHILAQIDCTAAIGLDPSHEKSYYRRAQAFKALGLNELALQDAKKCEEFSKSKTEVQNLVDSLKGKKNVAVLEVSTIRRDDYIQSEEEFTDVSIEFKTDTPHGSPSDEQTSSGIKEKPVKKIPLPPRRYQDFVSGVSRLKNDPLLLAEYFLKIDPAMYNFLFDDLLDNDVMTCILEALLHRLEQGHSSEQIGQKLIALTRASRFDLIIALMSDSDRKTIDSICSHLSPEDAALVRDKYDI